MKAHEHAVNTHEHQCAGPHLQEGQVASTPCGCHEGEGVVLDLLLWNHPAGQQDSDMV
jgi:hypothetical protein